MGHDALTNLAAFALQACVIAGVAAVVLSVVRIASAGTRYLCWRLVLAACLAMPLLLQRSVPTVRPDPKLVAATTDVAARELPGFDASVPAFRSAPALPSLPWGTVAMVIVAAGAAGRSAWLAIGLFRLRALRRHGERIDGEDYEEIQRTLGTRATLLSVAGLNQPATFGLWRPVVLLPDTLGESPLALRRAVVTHELFHVQRRDWLWVLAEESLRSVLWFHPAILWLTSRIQLAREELIDELTVLATGNRKAYIQALLAFADAGGVSPAPAFARRRHLFTRILRLSKETAMSSPRIVASAAAVIVAVVAAGWYASSVFPILSAAPADTAPPSSSMRPQPSGILPGYQVDRLMALVAGPSGRVTAAPAPRDMTAAAAGSAQRTAPQIVAAPGPSPQWSDYVRETQDSLRVLAGTTAAQGARSGGAPRPGPAAVAPPVPVPGTKPITPENPIPRRLSSIPVPYPAQLRGSGYRGAVTVRVILDASGAVSDVSAVHSETIANDVASAEGRAAAMNAVLSAASDAIRQWRYQPPADPPIAFFVRVTFGGEGDAQTEQTESFAAQGSLATVRFVAGTLADAVARLAALNATKAELSKRLQPEHPDMQRLDSQIREAQSAVERAKAMEQGLGVAGPGSTTGQPLRVGGNIRPPAKTKHVNPAYPEVARSAHVEGVVIIETTIDEQGRVAGARVLRSIPLLDQAALDAVRQWEFAPTLLNGAPIPIIMTMTVQFSLN